jgi:hypothetical protein
MIVLLSILQSSFNSSTSSLDFLLSQQQQQQHQDELISQQQQTLLNLDASFSDILYSQGHQSRSFHEQQTQHSNSSSDTLVGIEEEQSNDLLLPTITHFKEEPTFSTNPHTPINPQSVEQEHDLVFESSSSEELGLLSLRSRSDPTLSNTVVSGQPTTPMDESIDIPCSQASVDLDPNSLLPSFQDTYQIKYNQLADFGLKMDEECYNVGAHSSSVTSSDYQNQPQQQQQQQQQNQQLQNQQQPPPPSTTSLVAQQQHQQQSQSSYGFGGHADYLQNVGNFYQQHHYESLSMVSSNVDVAAVFFFCTFR